MTPDEDDKAWRDHDGSKRRPRRRCYVQYRCGFVTREPIDPAKRIWNWDEPGFPAVHAGQIVRYLPVKD